MVSIYGVLGLIIFLMVVIEVFFNFEGDAVIDVRTESRTPFKLEKTEKDAVTLSTKVVFANIGKQCGTIMDCYVRTLLPYEQYDGIEARSKAELVAAPREDDYFEAVLIPKKDSIEVLVKVTLRARKTDDIKAALVHMVDLPLDLVYQHTGRHPWTISKKRIVLTAAEIAGLVGITLAED